MALSKIDLALRLHGIVERHYRCTQCGAERTRTVISPAEVHDHRNLGLRDTSDDRMRA